jgi:hypothetical protein
MKNIILALTLLASLSSYAQTSTTVEFENKSQSFENIPEGTQLKIVYRFQNTGNTNFQLLNVATTCGCTVAEYPKHPIAPGARDSIVATFDTNHRLGQQAKGINLESNIGEINLIFTALVIPGDGTKEGDIEPTNQPKDNHAGHNHTP